jgi:ppGpp synthetase/RelA/SpoT-type nucleotidyltranferase
MKKIPIPDFSKNSINKAGDDLISPSTSSVDKRDAMILINKWRSCHAVPLNSVQASIKACLKKICTSPFYGRRLKRIPSIQKKLRRNTSMKLARMQDIGGLRTVLRNIDQVSGLQRICCDNLFTHEIKSIDDYIKTPKNDGYRSFHVVYKYNDKEGLYKNYNIELQIRTQTQHAWATAVETIGSYLGQALKSDEGPEEWKEYFKITSAAFALIEKSPTAEDFKSLSDVEIFNKCVELTRKLRVKDKLSAFVVATDKITSGATQGSYHLILLDTSLKTVSIKSFSKKNLEEASRAYEIQEREVSKNNNLETVLVAANSVADLRRAYPNYFLDTNEFIKVLHKIEARSPIKDKKTGYINKMLSMFRGI